jgi:hypothetical protein
VKTPTTAADLPHAFRPRVLGIETLPAGTRTDAGSWFYNAVRDPENRPCAVCGAGRFGMLIHMTTPRKPSLKRALAAVELAAAA